LCSATATATTLHLFAVVSLAVVHRAPLPVLLVLAPWLGEAVHVQTHLLPTVRGVVLLSLCVRGSFSYSLSFSFFVFFCFVLFCFVLSHSQACSQQR
jgi:hypothetical protein